MFTQNQEEALRDIGGDALLQGCKALLPMLGFVSYKRLTATKKKNQVLKELDSFAKHIARLSPDALQALGGHREVLPHIVEQCRNPKSSTDHRTKRAGRANLIALITNLARTHNIEFDDSRSSDLSEIVDTLCANIDFDRQMLVRDIVKHSK